MNSVTDEDFLDGFDDEEDDTFAGLGAGGFDRPVFDENQFKYAKSMSASIFKSEVENHIKSQPLTARYKRALILCAYTLFSEEQVLANNNIRSKSKLLQNDPLARKLVFAQRDIELTQCSATKYDMLAIDTFALEKHVLDVYECFISRTWGEKRERLINAEIGFRNINQSEIIKTNKPEQIPKRKKSLFSMNRGT